VYGHVATVLSQKYSGTDTRQCRGNDCSWTTCFVHAYHLYKYDSIKAKESEPFSQEHPPRHASAAIDTSNNERSSIAAAFTCSN
jgi:hypothetical protein